MRGGSAAWSRPLAGWAPSRPGPPITATFPGRHYEFSTLAMTHELAGQHRGRRQRRYTVRRKTRAEQRQPGTHGTVNPGRGEPDKQRNGYYGAEQMKASQMTHRELMPLNR
ncbi:hypothetical protein E2C01_083846 [Portunus trituberculatus]|uniref:Uncharacterized protein n=1 Tax=Portunus trituberculatus TaxID=210409 RepID=A0A5B7IY55_PORTR|nr:hypothetical protein [Portunus trituberculatus]